MIAEGLKLLIDHGRAAAPSIVRAEAEPAHVYYRRKKDGELERVEAEPPPQSHTVYDLAALVAAAKDADGSRPDGAVDGVTVWHGPDGVAVVFGFGGRSRVSLPLAMSAPLKLLIDWQNRQPAMQQPDLIRAMRITLGDCLAPAGNILDVLRKVKFKTGQEITSSVGHGSASLGKQIEGEVTGVGVLPPEVAFSVPIWSNPCLRHLGATVRCALDPDAATGTFRVIPLPGVIEGAIDSACVAVGQELRERLAGYDDVGVYYGKP